MIDQGELERIEIERAGRGKTGEHDAPAIQEQPELIPDETWAEGVGYFVDTCTSGLGTKTRSTAEKSALANCSQKLSTTTRRVILRPNKAKVDRILKV